MFRNFAAPFALAFVWGTVVMTTAAAKKAAPEPESTSWLPDGLVSPGLAGLIVLAHTTLTKLMMTLLWRGPGGKADRLGFPNWMGARAQLEKIPLYQIMHAVQLNEAEYAGPLTAALFFLAANGETGPSLAATLAVFGQLAYFWPRVFLANTKNYNNGHPFYVPAALSRYGALIMLANQIYGIVR